jgi:hypothetical protein
MKCRMCFEEGPDCLCVRSGRGPFCATGSDEIRRIALASRGVIASTGRWMIHTDFELEERARVHIQGNLDRIRDMLTHIARITQEEEKWKR